MSWIKELDSSCEEKDGPRSLPSALISMVSGNEEGKPGTSKNNTSKANILKRRQELFGKKGRPSTTGPYVRRQEALDKVNKAKEESLRLDREKKWALSAAEVLKAARINEEECIEEAERNPTGDLASVAREYMAEVVRISKTSSNLKETYQRTSR